MPLKALAGSRGAGEADARQALAIAVNKPVGDVAGVTAGNGWINRYAHVYPRAHPGTQAPLGWALSTATQQDLRDQIDENAEAIKAIRDTWLADDAMTCERR